MPNQYTVRDNHEPEGLRRCGTCKTLFPATAEYFYLCKAKWLMRHCKVCYSAIGKAKAKEQGYKYQKRARIKHPEKYRTYSKTSKVRLRLDVLSHYSSGKVECACCSENKYEFLALDHINGDGNRHRKLFRNNTEIYRWAKKNNYPPMFRVLCHNCNQAFGAYGYCPHQEKPNVS